MSGKEQVISDSEKLTFHDKIWNFDVSDPRLHPQGFTIYKVTCRASTKLLNWNDIQLIHVQSNNYCQHKQNGKVGVAEIEKLTCPTGNNVLKTKMDQMIYS